MTHRWLVPSDPGPAEAWTPPRQEALDPLAARVLWARGLREEEPLRLFLDPRMTGLHEPDLLAGCSRAADRLLSAARAGERIVIYGDYDVDGVCAASILFHMLRALAPACDVRTYVPHRLDEGYGLHAEAITQLASEGARVIVSVDCGVTAFDAARAAHDAGIDLIITDHHSLARAPSEPEAQARDEPRAHARGSPVPDAFAVIHPRIAGERGAYPFPDLCGAGVAFKLAWRIATLAEGNAKLTETIRMVLLDALALAALGTVADVVPLVGENRIIARHGLRRIRHTGLIGLRALIEASGLEGESIDEERVGFILGPRLNACGRMGHARDAMEMLTTAPPDRAREIARMLARLNDERRRTERQILDEAIDQAEQVGMTRDDRRAIVLAGDTWHAGVVGIVCSRMIERFHRPTILLQRTEGECQGSGRSIDGFNLHEALASCAPMLRRFGGHDMAAGLALDADRLPEFVEAFTEHANERLRVEDLTPPLRVDCAATLEELTERAVSQLGGLGPFGRGNPPPSLLLCGVEVARPPQPMGARGAHLSVFVRRGSREMRLVGWGWGDRVGALRAGSRIDAVIEPKVNRWNGSVRVEGELRDARIV